MNGGYVFILIGENKYIAEHRLKMEKKLKRKLKPSEIVHHKNHMRADNRLSNLELMSRADHQRHHRPRFGTGKNK